MSEALAWCKNEQKKGPRDGVGGEGELERAQESEVWCWSARPEYMECIRMKPYIVSCHCFLL